MKKEILVEESFTRRGATKAGNTIGTTDLALEFVVVCEFLTLRNITERVNDNPLTTLDFDDLGSTVWHTAMIDEPGNTAPLCGVDDGIFINSEEVAASNAALQVSSFSKIGDLLSNFLANILNDHVVHWNVLHGIQPPVVDGRPSKLDGLFPFLELIEA